MSLRPGGPLPGFLLISQDRCQRPENPENRTQAAEL